MLAQDESDPEAVPQPRVVEEVFRNLAQMMTLRVGDHTIETTPEHPFWVRGRGWTPAEAIEPGDELRSHDGQWIPLDAKEFSEALIPVFNMRVAEDHTYFVGSPLWGFSVWAHNTYEIPEGHVRGYRAVSESEYRDILATGELRVGPNSLEGKWFGESAEVAKRHGDYWYGQGRYRIIAGRNGDILLFR